MVRENERRDSSSTILLFVAGGLIGAGIALLYTPLTGTETRKYIRIKKDRANCKVTKMIENFRENVHHLLEETKGTIDKAIVEGTELTKEKKGELLSAVESGKKAMEEARKRIRSSSDNNGQE